MKTRFKPRFEDLQFASFLLAFSLTSFAYLLA